MKDSEVTINYQLEHEKYRHFDAEGRTLGYLNELQHLDLRIQIIKKKLKGYYLLVEDKKVIIGEDGFLHYKGDLNIYNQAYKLVLELNRLKSKELK